MQGIEQIRKQNQQATDALVRARANRDAGIPLTPGQRAVLEYEEWKADLKGTPAPAVEGPGPEPVVKYGGVYASGAYVRPATPEEAQAGKVL